MENDTIKKLEKILYTIEVTDENKDLLEEAQDYFENGDYSKAIEILQTLNINNQKTEENEADKTPVKEKDNSTKNRDDSIPDELSNLELEKDFIGLLLNTPKLIVKYFFPFEECIFEDSNMLNIYKSVLFTEGGSYSSEKAKAGFSFSKDSAQVSKLKSEIKNEIADKKLKPEKVYVDLRKLFILRKSFLETPILEVQEEIINITKYLLYDQMSPEEIQSAVIQVNDTSKFKRAILNTELTSFLKAGDNNLTNGLELPFSILSSVFKGIRKGETMAFAMPSNSGKSRFTINLAAYTAFVHKKRVLIISNEMSEEKMRLCLITTILNNKEIQKVHGQELKKTEGELLEFKYRPDNKKNVEVDENGFVLKQEGETHQQFVKRLSEISSEFNKTLAVTDWVNKEINNSIYFINITDHTNDELKKVIINYYYKEKIEYVFYDTLKTDTANIGIGEELKKTATILSNLAQNFNIFICSTLQLAETSTLPVNLTVNDLAVSRTVKEVLDTLSLIKQINRDTYNDYEYSLNEVDTKFFNLEKFEDPDIRYYSCVVDKNRAGAKPAVLFRLNLAYNFWEELGYLRLKQTSKNS